MYQQPSPLQGLLANRKLLVIGGGGIIAIILGLILLNSGGGGDIKTAIERLSVRYDNLVKLTTSAQPNINSSGLTKINAETNVMAASDDVAIANLVKTRYGSVDGSVTQSEADTSSATTLSNARQLNTYDAVYKSLLSDKLNNALLLVNEVISKSNNPDTLSVMKRAQTNLKALVDRLSNVSL